MKVPADKLEALRRAAEAMNSSGVQELLRLAAVAREASRREADPTGRNHPVAADFTARRAAGATTPGEAEELFKLAASGNLPPRFLDTVQRLAENPPAESRQRAYLAALIDFRLRHEHWPHAAAADRHAIELFPDAFAGVGTDAGDKTFRRLREALGIDWLPEGRPGRPRK